MHVLLMCLCVGLSRLCYSEYPLYKIHFMIDILCIFFIYLSKNTQNITVNQLTLTCFIVKRYKYMLNNYNNLTVYFIQNEYLI